MCDSGYYSDEDLECQACGETCKTCSGGEKCETCPDGWILGRTICLECLENEYVDGNSCLDCGENCL